MTVHDTRSSMLRRVLRGGGPARIARVLDRLSPTDLAQLFGGLDALELRRAAAVLFEPARVRQSLDRLDRPTLVTLVAAANDAAAAHALIEMGPRAAAPVLASVSAARRGQLLDALEAAGGSAGGALRDALPRPLRGGRLGGARTPDPVFRLRRLFA